MYRVLILNISSLLLKRTDDFRPGLSSARLVPISPLSVESSRSDNLLNVMHAYLQALPFETKPEYQPGVAPSPCRRNSATSTSAC